MEGNLVKRELLGVSPKLAQELVALLVKRPESICPDGWNHIPAAAQSVSELACLADSALSTAGWRQSQVFEGLRQ